MKNTIERLDALNSQRDYWDALKLVEEILAQCPYSSFFLVKKAQIIQLLNKCKESEIPPLSVVEECLKFANLLGPNSIESYIESGCFEYTVKDNPKDALEYFETARKNAEKGLKSALIGKIKCYLDMGRMSEAKDQLANAKVLFPEDDEFVEIEFEIETI